MTDKQKEFLRLHVICQEDYNTISNKLNESRASLSQWYEELKLERMEITKIRTLWKRKKICSDFEVFYKWYKSHERRCDYCGITEKEISFLIENRQLETKRLATRGRSLELDRKDPKLMYDDLNNIVFACYWCNNAKTDTFTYQEFKEVGNVFSKIWKERYKNIVDK